jgi:hypothetical protein
MKPPDANPSTSSASHHRPAQESSVLIATLPLTVALFAGLVIVIHDVGLLFLTVGVGAGVAALRVLAAPIPGVSRANEMKTAAKNAKGLEAELRSLSGPGSSLSIVWPFSLITPGD